MVNLLNMNFFKKQMVFAVFCAIVAIPNLFGQLDTIPELRGRTCIPEVFCIDTGTCLVKPIKFTCEATSKIKLFPYLFYKYDVDYNSDGNIDLSGTNQALTLDGGNGLVPGKHKLIWYIKDISNITNKCEKLFEVRDCVKPTILVKNVVKKQVVPSGCSWNFRTADLIDGASDNCTPTSKLRYRIYNGEKHNLTAENVLALKDSLVVESPITTTYVTVYVLDESNNIDTRIIQIDLDYQSCSVAGDSINVRGVIATVKGDVLKRIAVYQDSSESTGTNDLGIYSTNIAMAGITTIKPEKVIEPRNGVTTADMVAINKYILKVDTLASQYSHVAADVNSDKKISVSDLIEIRKLILFIIDNFSVVNSWKFIPKSYVFDIKPEADPYPEFATVVNPKTDTVVDFVAIKMGDVNNSSRANSFPLIPQRALEAKHLLLHETLLPQDHHARIDLPIADLHAFDGFQLALTLDPSLVDLMDVEGLDSESYSWDPATGRFLVSYIAGLSTGSTLILELQAKKATTLSSCIRFDNTWLNNEYYDQGQAINLEFQFVTQAGELVQNQPNPFVANTTITFKNATAGELQLTIFDAAGNKLYQTKRMASIGLHTFEINDTMLPQSGVFLYQISTSSGIWSRKMVRVHSINH